MMGKGSECSGSRLFDSYHGMRYHVVDDNNRYYLCGCHKPFRISSHVTGVKHPFAFHGRNEYKTDLIHRQVTFETRLGI